MRKGLLYAGTENAAYVSFDDGDHWSSLQLNMPTTSVRDLVVHGDDLVAATYGRAFWILDDLTPLRQIDASTAATAALLFRPERALRARLDLNQDTPLPPEMPAGQNPPNGAILDYYLSTSPAKDITLEIYDSAGKLVRQYSTKADAPSAEPPPNVPDYWIGHPEPLTRNSGMNRFVWDLRYAPPPVLRHEYPISALYQGTPGLPLGAIATPGTYRVKLQVNGRTYEQPLTVAMDPRVDVSNEALAQQLDLESKIIDLVAESYDFYHKALLVRQTLAGDQKELEKHAGAALTTLKDFDQKAMRLQGSDTGFGGGAGRGVKQAPAFAPLNRNLGSLAIHRGRPGRSSDTGHAVGLRGVLPRPGLGSAKLERAIEGRASRRERRTGEAGRRAAGWRAAGGSGVPVERAGVFSANDWRRGRVSSFES